MRLVRVGETIHSIDTEGGWQFDKNIRYQLRELCLSNCCYCIGTCERRVFHVGVPDYDWMFRVPLIYLRILMQNGLVEQSSVMWPWERRQFDVMSFRNITFVTYITLLLFEKKIIIFKHFNSYSFLFILFF